MTTALIYPHQLFKNHPALSFSPEILLIEEPLFFNQYRFHKQKLLFHRASMRAYEDYLKTEGYTVRYLACHEVETTEKVFDHITPGDEVVVCEVDDDWLNQRLRSEAALRSIPLRTLDSPGFYLTKDQSVEALKRSKGLMAAFYREQRLREQILVQDEKPVGGKWSFDAENRRKLPKDIKPPQLPTLTNSALTRELERTVTEEFPDASGDAGSLRYPSTFSEAEAWLENFLHHRFSNYGTYQDAISSKDSALFHSLLSPLINVGLLTPHQVIERALIFAKERNLPLNTVEGFVRQILGWREYVRAAYHLHGRRERTRNYFGHTRRIPHTFWTGETGVDPVDIVIRRVLATGYCNHIERLMVIGNFMLLCEFDPDDIYRWFMELFIDAYDWVMVPNVYGMSQYADGGLITTKPYISSANYILKMSDFKRSGWSEIWDGLYWRFVAKHREYFSTNHRTGMMVLALDKLEAHKLAEHQRVAESFLARQ